ncbi:MAG: glycosyltransferase [Actinomycetota bacterium]
MKDIEDAPRTTKDLRVVGLTGPRVQTAVEDACTWLTADDRINRSDIVDLRPHLLLAEVANPREMAEERLTELVAYVREADSSAALWLSDIAHSAACPYSIRDLFDAVFCADPGLWFGAIGLPHAASRQALSAEEAQSDEGVGLVVEAIEHWDVQFSPRLEPLMAAAAEHPFAVLAMEPRAPGLPTQLEPLARAGRDDDDRVSFIRQLGVIVSASPTQASALYMPAVVFDAVALGVPVVIAQPVSGGLLPHGVVGLAAQDAPSELIDRALTDGEFGPGMRDAGRRSVRHGHTYVHRLATAASAVGFTVMPSYG